MLTRNMIDVRCGHRWRCASNSDAGVRRRGFVQRGSVRLGGAVRVRRVRVVVGVSMRMCVTVIVVFVTVGVGWVAAVAISVVAAMLMIAA